ncbi:TPA: hypothetical protein ACX6PR_000002 [Photobacterium damselae]
MSAKLKRLDFKLQRSHLNGGSKVKDTIFIELDRNTEPYNKLSHFFCQSALNVNKRSDLVIYHDKEEYLAILICDLKSSPQGCRDDRAMKQFMNSHKFIQYVNDLGFSYYEVNKPVRYFYISFYPMLPMSSSTLIGTQSGNKLMTHDAGVNLESVNIDTNGQGELLWTEILNKLP